jgi:hypothetical protein
MIGRISNPGFSRENPLGATGAAFHMEQKSPLGALIRLLARTQWLLRRA